MNRIRNGPSTRVTTSRGWRRISKISFRRKQEARMMPRKKSAIAPLWTHDLYTDIFKGRHPLLHRLHRNVLLLSPSHQVGGGGAGLAYDNAHTVGTGADRFGPHKGQRAQHSLGLEVERLCSAEI